MKFRRKKDAAPSTDEADTTVEESEPTPGPYDADELPDDGVQRVDLGSLLIQPEQGRELRLQVDETSGQVQSVLLAGKDGAIELRAFAAPRNGDLWSEVRPQIAADMAQRGGTATEREGRFGTELVCQVQVKRSDGGTAVQPSRIVGINGPRWLLRATFLGKPAVEIDGVDDWEDTVTKVAVRRGAQAMPVGEPLPVVLPDQARRVPPPQD
ncbi:MAG: DUF3710 domain-containing protein [Actinomycetota bacterium]|nr:DUF3710 domain-containing protein [Actinomycetota bacterium]